MVKLMHDDCFKMFKSFPVGLVDMILTDPPYEISTSKGGGMVGKDGRFFMKEMEEGLKTGINVPSFLDSCLSLFESKEQFCGVFFCSNKQLVQYLSFANDNNLQYGVGVWHKTDPPPLCNFKYLNDVEYWLYIKGKGSKILGSYESKSMVYRSPSNTLESKWFKHPTIKPVSLMKKFIINHTIKGMTVLDPFMGSGSTGVACVETYRKFIGIEQNREYFDIATKRLSVTNKFLF